MVTGRVSANTAIGRLDASMLEIATTSSMTNSMNVPACSSTPIGLIRMKVHATPKNRSSRIKRIRQERSCAVARRLGEELPAGADDDEMDEQRAGGPHAADQRAGPQARTTARW